MNPATERMAMKVHEHIDTELLADQAIVRMLLNNYRAPIMALPRDVLGELGRRLLDGATHRYRVWKWLSSEGHHFSSSAFYRFADQFHEAALAVQRELLPHLARQPLLTPEEVADVLTVTPQSVDALIESRELAAIRVGDAIRVAPADLDAYMAKQSTWQNKRRRRRQPSRKRGARRAQRAPFGGDSGP